MLIKHESFDILQPRKIAEGRNGSDKLYDEKNCPYLKYLLIPGIIAFMLLCILVNVDFGNDNRGNVRTNIKTKVEKDENTVPTVTDTDLHTNVIHDELVLSQNPAKVNPYDHKRNFKSDMALPNAFVIVNDKALMTSGSVKTAISPQESYSISTQSHLRNPYKEGTQFSNFGEKKPQHGKYQRHYNRSTLTAISQDGKHTRTTNFSVEARNINVGNSNLVRKQYQMGKMKAEKQLNNMTDKNLELKHKTLNKERDFVVEKNVNPRETYFNDNQSFENKTHQIVPTTLAASKISHSLAKAFTNFDSDRIGNAMIPQMNQNVLFSKPAAGIPAIKCTKNSKDCSLKCDTGGLSHLDQDLEDFQPSCGQKGITLELRNCIFVNGVMKSNLLVGHFTLQELHIINCTLTTIEDGAFKPNGAQTLRVLKFIDNSIASFTNTTFLGLKQLKHFEFSQHVQGKEAIGNNFLSPLAATLTSVKIMQSLDNEAQVDPRPWLQGANFVALYVVDYQNNNLRGMLRADTFKSLTAVGNLNLQYCSLTSIDIKIFLPVLSTLDYLCLDHNQLVTLDAPFLDQLEINHVTLSAADNDWQCVCDNFGMIDYMKNEYENEYINKDHFICSGPPPTKGQHMKDLNILCEDPTETPITDGDLEVEVTTISSTQSSTTNQAPVDTTTTDGGTDPTQLERVVCVSPDAPEDDVIISLVPQTAELTFIPIAAGGVKIISSIDSTGCSLLQFYNSSVYWTVQRTSSTEWRIEYPMEYHAYMFCLVHGNNDTISPFDCWGYSVEISSFQIWLLSNDKGWFVSVMVVVTLGFCAVGGGTVYFALSRRPSWLLATSERLIRAHHSSHKIILLPKRSSTIERNSGSTERDPRQRAKTASYLSPTADFKANAMSHTAYYASRHKPPTDRAPAPPDIVQINACRNARRLPRPSLQPLCNTVGQQHWSFRAEENDYGSNSSNYYEEIRF